MKKILHIDNSSFVRKIIRNIVIEKGLQFNEADRASEAMEIMNEEKIDLIITGLELAYVSGEELFDSGVVDYIKGNKSSV